VVEPAVKRPRHVRVWHWLIGATNS
jgi:hypothetical protein